MSLSKHICVSPPHEIFSSSISRPLNITLRPRSSHTPRPQMRYYINSYLCFHLNPVLLPNFRRSLLSTSYSISELLQPLTLQPNTSLNKMPNISSRLSDKPHPYTTLSKLSTPFTKNVTTNDRQDGHYLMPVTIDQLTLHERNTPSPLPCPICCF